MTSGRFCRWIAALLICFLPLSPAQAQNVASAATTAAPAAPTADQLQQLVSTLKDDKARAQLVDQLQALIAAQNATEQKKTISPFAWFSTLPGELDAIGAEVLSAVPIFAQAPRGLAWLRLQANDPELQQRWIGIAEKLAAIFGAGILAGLVTRLLLRRPAERLLARTSERWPVRLLLLIAGAFVEALPVLVFAAVATFVLPLTDPHTGTRGVAKVVITATVWARGVLAVAWVLLLSPGAQTLYDLTEETRHYLYIWTRRFVAWSAYGSAASAGAWWLGAPSAIVGLLIRASVLVLAVLAIIFVLQNRSAVAQWLRGRSSGGGWRLMRSRLADTWHVLAIVYIVGTFGVFMLNAEGGLNLLLRATALSLVVVTTAAILIRFIEQALRTGFAIGPDLKTRFPTLDARANRYVPVLSWASSSMIYVLAALALLQAWGVNAFSWLQATAGSRAATSLFGIVVALAVALVAWELFVSALERYLQNLESDSRRHARARTLFPMLRLIVLIVLAIILGFVVLGQLGINLGALIAGAGVFGIIAGLGSQSILKDFMTSIAVLIDDTFAVGDVIDVGNGCNGVVERMSIRTIKLRAFDGSLRTVPFSEMKTIQNLTKDYSYYVANVLVSNHEDTDRVVVILKAVVDEMRKDETFGPSMLESLDVAGVDRFADGGVIIMVRMKTLPIHQWVVGREFNRRMKQAFQRENVELPSSSQTIYLAANPKEDAPPVRIDIGGAKPATPSS